MRAKRKSVEVGDHYGRYTVLEKMISLTGKGIRRTMVLCKCDCGTTKTIRADGLTSGHTRSCGCLELELKGKRTAERNRKTAKFSGFSQKNPNTWLSWTSMINRCYNKKQKTYSYYGARGTIVCESLKKDPRNLIKIIGYRKKKEFTLDRFPIHNGNYVCGQCNECKKNGWKLNIRWATRKDQSNNRGDFNVYLTAFGKTLTREQWSDISGGLDSWRIHRRIHELGWSIEKALTTPDKKGRCYRP